MKKLIRKTGTVVITLLLLAGTGAVRAQQQADTKEDKTFRMGMYRIKNTLKMKMMIEKEKGHVVAIKLYDKKNRIMQRHLIGKRAGLHAIQFDFENVADGDYRLEVVSGDEKEVKNIRLSTAEFVEVHHPRTLVALN